MNYKIKILIISLAIVILAGASLYIFKNSQTKKVEIKTNEEQTQSTQDLNNQTSDLGQEQIVGSEIPQNSAPEKIVPNPAEKTTETKKESSNNKSLKIIDKLVNFGFSLSSGRTIDTIIIHSTYDAIGSDSFSVAGVIAEYRSYGVSPHYLIDRAGNIYRLVEDKNIAYHAGVSQTPDGRTNVNDFSIGIELINTKTDKVTDAQYASLNNLIFQLKSEYKIKYVLGHNQIAPGRKDDPWNFDWKRLK